MILKSIVWVQSAIAALETRARDEEGQALVEYSLILVLVGVALIVALGSLKTGITGAFTKVTNAIK